MNREELITEICRVEEALKKTNSRKLRHDYGRYLKRLYQNLRYYDKHMARYKAQKSACNAGNLFY